MRQDSQKTTAERPARQPRKQVERKVEKKAGTVYHDTARGVVRYRISRKGADGLPKTLDSATKVPVGATKADIEAIIKTAEGKIEAFMERVENPTTALSFTATGDQIFGLAIGNMWDKLAETPWARGKKPATRYHEKTVLMSWMKALGEGCLVEDVTVANVVHWCQHWQKKGMSQSTLEHRLHVISSYLRQAEKLGHTVVTLPKPIDVYGRFEARTEESSWLRPEQIRQCHEKGAGHEGYLAFLLGVCAGLRAEEVCGLTWAAIKLGDDPWLKVQQVVVKNASGSCELRHGGKSTAAVRLIPIAPALANELRRLRDLAPESKFLYENKRGRSKSFMPLQTYQTMCDSFVEACGMVGGRYRQSLKSHCWRRTFATYLGLVGLDEKHRNYVFGHKRGDLMDTVYRGIMFHFLPPAIAKTQELMTNEDGAMIAGLVPEITGV